MKKKKGSENAVVPTGQMVRYDIQEDGPGVLPLVREDLGRSRGDGSVGAAMAAKTGEL